MDVASPRLAPVPQAKRPSRLGWKIGFLVCFTLLLLEGVLRIQTKFKLALDLDMADVSMTSISDELNHMHVIDGVNYDEYGLKNFSTLIDTAVAHQANARKILFMGDSFMEGLGGKDDLAWHVYDHYRQNQLPMLPCNAGCSSYSPSIFIPQARKLIPHVKPNHVVVVIDNTDLADDAYRYINLVERDEQGQIVRVKHTPVNMYFTRNMIEARSHWLYLVRYIHKMYVTKRGVFQFDGGSREKMHEKIFALINDSTTQPAEKYQSELVIFEKNLRDLADLLIQQMGKDNVLWVCHPQPHHFSTAGGLTPHHRLVPESVARIAAEKGIHFYDSMPDLAKIIGDHHTDYYLNDAIYHFNAKGIAAYGKCIYDHLPATWKQPTPRPIDVTSK